jgi:hypothetical protein
MKELIIVCLIALVITPILATLNVFGLKQDPAETMAPKPFTVMHKITAASGAVGCRSKEALYELAKYSKNKNSEAMQGMMNERVCVYFASGSELLLQDDACKEESKDLNVFASMPKGMKSEFYFSCSAI